MRARTYHRARAVALAAISIFVVPAVLAAQAMADSTRPAADSAKSAAADSSILVAFSGFLDSYFAYDFGKPRDIDRALTTQAVRHDEFNINLAYVDATLTGPRVRGRFAAQFGTSVQTNYAAEPRIGNFSGPDVSRYIQEATAGYKVFNGVWVDAGVFFAPFGSENWISRDNWTYTRSLIADNSPYYEAGVKATWTIDPKWTAQLHVINGWQNISETNSSKALGARIDFAPRDGLSFAYDLFVGNEQPDSLPSRLRTFNEIIVGASITSKLQLRGTLDVGTQGHTNGEGTGTWNGYAILARYQLSQRVALAGRVEGYSDPDQFIINTGETYGVQASGASLGVDVAPMPKLLWRSEVKWLGAKNPLFPDQTTGAGLSKHDVAIVSSLALTL
ncbi:MAG: porin [Gemmatimonadota bacterium]|nr:porin [Gemmatimonadota bacterium]